MDDVIDDLLNDLFDEYAVPGTFGLEMDRNDFLAACEELLVRLQEIDSPGLTE
jgi:hypothetical protein